MYYCLAAYKIHPRASLRIFPPTACLRWTGTPVSDFHVQLREWASCGPRPLPHVGIYNPMRAVPRSSRRHYIPLTRMVFASGSRLLGPRGRAHLSRQMDKFLIFIVILKQNVAKLSSLWRSAPAKPRKHVGHGAQAKRKQWVNFGG